MRIMVAVFVLSLAAAGQMTESRLLKLDQDFAQATGKRQVDGMMDYVMDSTVIFWYNSPMRTSGPDEIRRHFQELFATPGFVMTWTPQTAELLPTGVTGYTTGTFHWVIPNPGCRCAADWHGTYLAVWERKPCPDLNPPWKLKALFPSLGEGSIGGCGCAP
jgi:ketosteroid isomerase-like protein